MGCRQTKNLEQEWQQPSSLPTSGQSSSKPVQAVSSPPSSAEPLVVTHARARLLEIGAPMLEYSQFSVKKFLQEGGMGTVYYGIRKSDGQPVALKFFGYTHRAPSEECIRDEIRVMMALKNVDGVVHLYGAFLDSPSGYIEGKRYPAPRPVLVMEYLAGGDLCDRITQMSSVSESDLATAFRQILLALKGIHSRRYIHRDLKLENIMLLNQNPDSPIRLIDFGMMIELPDNSDVVVTKVSVGTPGYIAPESILNREYSFKSDVWQAGCCLYNLLSGHFPFDPDQPTQIYEGTYFPMVGEDWDRISDSAKNLVESMLHKDSNIRLSIDDLLLHPWLQGENSQSDLGKKYSIRIKNLSLRRKLRQFFINNDLNMANQRQKLEAVFPSLQVSSPTVGRSHGITELGSPLDTFESKKTISRNDNGSISQEKLDTFQTLMINELQGTVSRKTHVRSTSGRLLSQRPKKEVNYETFCSILDQAELTELAKESVFAIFDSNNTGTIDLKEFLLTMLALRPFPTSGSQEEDTIRLYFNLFDLNQSGRIDEDELKLCLEYILPDDMVRAQSFPHTPDPHSSIESQSPERNSNASLASNIFEMFVAMDTSKDGYIDYEEFKMFYLTIMKNSSSGLGMNSTKIIVDSTEVSSRSRDPSPMNARSRSPSPNPPRSLSPLPKAPSRSPSTTPPRQHSPPPIERNRTQSTSPTPPSVTPPQVSPSSPKIIRPETSNIPTDDTPKIRKGTSAGLAARIQGLDPTKIVMPGMAMPPKRSPPPAIMKSTSLPPESSNGAVNIDPLMSRSVLKTSKPRRRQTVRRRSSADLKEQLAALPNIVENS